MDIASLQLNVYKINHIHMVIVLFFHKEKPGYGIKLYN